MPLVVAESFIIAWPATGSDVVEMAPKTSVTVKGTRPSGRHVPGVRTRALGFRGASGWRPSTEPLHILEHEHIVFVCRQHYVIVVDVQI
jgi:hypothetical protein